MPNEGTRTVEVGSTWRRNPPGREVVTVQRVWDWDGPTVRVHPVHGGRPPVAPVAWFIEHYTLEAGRG